MPSGAARALMVFHHIRSAKKIRTLHAWSAELDLHGIVKVGYPGLLLVCDRVPVSASHVDEFVRRVKRLPWQSCEARAVAPVSDPREIEAFAHALASHAATSSVSRKSGLAQLDRLRDVTPIMRGADAHLQARAGAPAWEAFYRMAWAS